MIANVRGQWLRLSDRERLLVVLATVVIVLGAGWPLFWQPIERDLAVASRELVQARRDAIALQESADDVAALRKRAIAPRTADVRAAVESVIAARGLRPALTALDASEGRVRATFGAIDTAALAALVDALGREELVFVREAMLVARVDSGVRAELTRARAEPR